MFHHESMYIIGRWSDNFLFKIAYYIMLIVFRDSTQNFVWRSIHEGHNIFPVWDINLNRI